MATTPTAAVFRVEIGAHDRALDAAVARRLAEAGLTRIAHCSVARLFFLEGGLDRAAAEKIATELLADPVVETVSVSGVGDVIRAPANAVACEVHLKPGVMDPVAQTTLAELQAEGFDVGAVRTARRYVVTGDVTEAALARAAAQALANDCIERIVGGTAGVAPSPHPPEMAFDLRHVPLRQADGEALQRLSRDGHLFLTRGEMQAVQGHFRTLDREPTDLELETIAQTWSEHCVHKTLKSAVAYRGAPFPNAGGDANAGETSRQYENLLRDTIARVTHELIAAGRGPECLSVFTDNAGVVGFDEQYGIAFKVETHNHPSAIEPYGGAATGIGGCIRDIMGCGRGARPIAATDVFCVAPGDWPREALPQGVLHPARILREVVRGVGEYGNRMGIPTVNGAVAFDPRYLGNPLVYCGTVGIMPRWAVSKAPQPGDLVVVLGGRTGRDGIHGATFSSAELTTTHADEFSHAVQIGNAITQKRALDALLRARDHADGCLFTATTDCGAGGLSSAVGEMGEEIGVEVDLDAVPLKYAGLRYDEIWISEAQERMVLAVPPANLDKLLAITHEEAVDATVIGRFGSTNEAGAAQLVVRYQKTVVGELEMGFLHHGLPKQTRAATWQPAGAVSAPPVDPNADGGPPEPLAQLEQLLAAPGTASNAWIIRQYDHEVQGGSVIKPTCGPGRGPSDAAVLRPRLDRDQGVAVGCGLALTLADADPYWMAVNSIDEAVRNVVAVGGDPRATAILDNFCWGRTDDPEQLGALVRACQACYDTALAYGTPFISGKDSLNNEFALSPADVERVAGRLAGLPGARRPARRPPARARTRCSANPCPR